MTEISNYTISSHKSADVDHLTNFEFGQTFAFFLATIVIFGRNWRAFEFYLIIEEIDFNPRIPKFQNYRIVTTN